MASLGFDIEVIGLIAAFLTTSAFAPQAYRVWRLKEVKDISLTMYVAMLLGIILWFIYGTIIDSLSIKIANVVSFVLVASIIFFKVKYREDQ